MHGLHKHYHRGHALGTFGCRVPLEIGASNGARKGLADLGVRCEMKASRVDVPDVYLPGCELMRRDGVPHKRDDEMRI